MTLPEETHRIVESYFSAWTSKDTRTAYALLAADLEFWGPTASHQSADAFRPALEGFAAMTKAARIDLLIDGDRAALLYDCELPQPVGMIKIASVFLVENDRIRTYDTLFDATELRKLRARRGAQ
jgi:hypothetical protein